MNCHQGRHCGVDGAGPTIDRECSLNWRKSDEFTSVRGRGAVRREACRHSALIPMWSSASVDFRVALNSLKLKCKVNATRNAPKHPSRGQLNFFCGGVHSPSPDPTLNGKRDPSTPSTLLTVQPTVVQYLHANSCHELHWMSQFWVQFSTCLNIVFILTSSGMSSPFKLSNTWAYTENKNVSYLSASWPLHNAYSD